MTPVLVSSNDACGVVLVVQMPGTVCIDEHAIGIVHEVLGKISLGTQTTREPWLWTYHSPEADCSALLDDKGPCSFLDMSASCHDNNDHIDEHVPAMGASVGTPGEK